MKQDAKYLTYKIENEVADCFNATGIKKVLVAVSGGADSVALLRACCRIGRRLALRIEAVNCNFHLRGEESNRDSMFTSDLCKSLGVKLYSLDYDVEDYVRMHPGISTEMACRELRYADFNRIMETEEFERIAVAHNADDDIETMMLNMLRGSGSRGLKGMDRDNGKVIRPLLGISRKEIEMYLESIDSKYIIDSSNLTSEYRRNFIRRDILPLLERQWRGARKSLYRTVGIVKEENQIIEDFYNKELTRLCPNKETLLVYAEGVNIGIIWRFIEPYGGNTEIANEIKECLDKEFKERTWQLTERYEAILERDRLIILDKHAEISNLNFIWTKLAMTPETMAEVKKNRNHNIVFLPSGESEYVLRRHKHGDRISPLGMRGTRLVSDIISDAKLSRKEKSQIRVLARKSDDEIIWVAGLKRSRYDLIELNSGCCFKLELMKDEQSAK